MKSKSEKPKAEFTLTLSSVNDPVAELGGLMALLETGVGQLAKEREEAAQQSAPDGTRRKQGRGTFEPTE